MENITKFFINNDNGMKVIWSIVWLFVVMIIINIINRLLFKYINDNVKYYTARKRVYYTFSIVLILILAVMWGGSSENLTTYVGLLSAGIAIALKDLFANLAGWLFIIIRKPFEVGQRIQFDDRRGDVIDIRMFQFSLMEVTSYNEGEQSTGRIIDVPNYFIFTHPISNYTKGFQYIWNEIKVLITFESDWELAKECFTDIVTKQTMHLTKEAKTEIREAARKYMIHYNKLTPIVYTDVKESGIELSIRYLCSPKQRRTTSNLIWEDILRLVQENETINLAYPTMRIVGTVPAYESQGES